MATNHQSPQATLPPLKYKTINTTTWGANPNTLTITDTYISPNSQVDAWVTGTVPQAGQWSYTVTGGQCIITTSQAESST